MSAVIFLCVFVFGTIVGSFLNVVLLRKNTGKSIVWEPSHCFSCDERLWPKDLIPIFSFLFFRGKCSHCGSKISLQYPIVEFLIGGLFLLVSNKISVFNFLSFVFYASSFSALFLIAAYDFKQKIIDSNFFEIFTVFAITEAVLRWHPVFSFERISADLASSFIIALFFYLAWRISGGRWMGRGDANLAFSAALFLGWPASLSMFLVSFWIGGFFGAGLLIFYGRKYGLKSEIPFGPFLAIGTFILWYFGDFLSVFLRIW